MTDTQNPSLEQPSLPRVDVLLATATEVEGKAVLGVLLQEKSFIPKSVSIGNNTYFDLGAPGGARVFMVQSGMGSGGVAGSLLTLQEAITTLSPATVIMIGIAFGIDEKKQRIGDILASEQLLLYDLQKISTDTAGNPTLIPRGDPFVSQCLRQLSPIN